MPSSFDFLFLLASKLHIIMENRMDRTEKMRNERRRRADQTRANPVIVPPPFPHPANNCEKSRIFMNLLEFTWICVFLELRDGRTDRQSHTLSCFLPLNYSFGRKVKDGILWFWMIKKFFLNFFQQCKWWICV